MYFQSSLVIRCGMQTRLNCQSSYFTEQWWIFTRLCTPTKFYRQVQPAFWRYLRNDSLSNSFITFTHGHPLIQNNGPASREKKSYDTWCYFTVVKRFHSDTHERRGSVSAWHFLIPLQGTKRRTTTGVRGAL